SRIARKESVLANAARRWVKKSLNSVCAMPHPSAHRPLPLEGRVGNIGANATRPGTGSESLLPWVSVNFQQWVTG
ncbi:hypothetical protein JEG40_12130, partial [Streptococcus agalactiae]|nr:hypothetical protein [Streptococcus agalactiae]